MRFGEVGRPAPNRDEVGRPVPGTAMHDEPPPFLGAWRRVYIAVICYLAAIIALFYWFSRAFAE